MADILSERIQTLQLDEAENSDVFLKENVNIVFVGHVDAGKSTISGQILYYI